jgi:hypothetical protein
MMFAKAAALACLLLSATAWAGGPRFVTGSQFSAAGAGQFMAFRTNQPLYFTDAGGLGPAVTHAQADAMVAAAAAVWNTPTSSLVISQGGTLAEDVSGANVSFGNAGIVWPADVMASNYLAAPIAVVYDADGSVTDLLLGEGASDPTGCRQTGVTESVDAFGQAGTIDHAVLVINGRCVSGGAALSQQLLQLQYQLTRAFGRVLGLAWSQLNDNVFTGATPATLAQRQAWPLMHPIDILCGPYTYQCTVNPFTLREDDIAALDLLYPVPSASPPAGKTWTLQNAVALEGWICFPTGEGMDQLNVTVMRSYAGQSYVQPWQIASGVTGMRAMVDRGNPVTGPSPASTPGSPDWDSPAFFTIGRVDVGYTANLWLTTEAINPLYVGAYAVGPYRRPAITPSGSALMMVGQSELPGYMSAFVQTVVDGAAACSPNDGSESAPVAADPSGWWTGLLCGAGHTSWWSATVKAGRSWTLEATALNEMGNATRNKSQPVIGVWNATDATGTLPTIASQGLAMNAMAMGTTQLQMAASATAATLRIAVADQFGGGRPDFAYRMRVLYADSVAPSQVGTGGDQIVLTGTGFRSGNRVIVNGVAATVVSCSPTQIVAMAPSMLAAGATAGVVVDVAVVDASTGGATVVRGALMYIPGALPPDPSQWRLTVVSGAGQSVVKGSALAPVTLQVTDAAGQPVQGATVTVHQDVQAWEGVCPTQGRCAAAPVLTSSTATVASDASGNLVVTPLVVAGQPQVVNLVATTGTSGFVSLSLTVKP